MPTGAEAFQRKQAQREAQRTAQGANSIKADYFGIAGGTFAVVRFLEEGDNLTYADVHRVPVGRQYPVDFICLDNGDDGTPCPGCMSEDPKISKRNTKGYVNVIWRDGPVYERNEWGTPKKDPSNPKQKLIVGQQDGVFLWKCSGEVFGELIAKDSKYKGLMSRDFEIRRTGSGMNDTKYTIDPADVDSGPQPMTIADENLAEKKYNLAEITTPLSFADFTLAMSGQAPQEGPQSTMDRSAMVTADNVFQGGEPVRSSAFQRG